MDNKKNMNKLIVSEDGYLLGSKLYKDEDLFSGEFYRYSDSVADNYKYDSFLENEIFLYIVQPYLAVLFFLQENHISVVKIRKCHKDVRRKFVDAAQELKLSVDYNKIIIPGTFIIRLVSYVKLLGTAMWILIHLVKIPFKKGATCWKEYIIITDKAAAHKIRNFDIHKEVFDLEDKASILRFYPKAERLSWLFKSLSYAMKCLQYDYRQVLIFVGKSCGESFLERYSIRLVGTYLYSFLLEKLFNENSSGVFYTGNNLDRWALAEEKMSEKYLVKTICIPHGLEYGFKFPYGFTTSKIYTTSTKAAIHLNKLYSINKFIFDESITSKMFKVNCDMTNKERKVVFFSEPREPQVNIAILSRLLPMCEQEGIQVYIKHHPNDNIDDYVQFGGRLPVLNNLNEALSANICISRKSTTLIEALYNGSKSAAIITNNKDKSIFMTFPSLQDDRISVFYDVNELFQWILTEYSASLRRPSGATYYTLHKTKIL